MINWKKAVKVAAGKKAVKINDHTVIPMQVAIDEGLIVLIPEPKSPHGIDVSPDGKYMVVSGKLDSHTYVFGWDKIKKAMDAKDWADKDPYGIPILDMKKVLNVQVPLGLGLVVAAHRKAPEADDLFHPSEDRFDDRLASIEAHSPALCSQPFAHARGGRTSCLRLRCSSPIRGGPALHLPNGSRGRCTGRSRCSPSRTS